jgi:ribosomal protein S27E
MTQHSNVPLRAARVTTARGNSSTVHNTCHLAARHKTAADSCGETLVPPAGGVSSAMTLTAALRK